MKVVHSVVAVLGLVALAASLGAPVFRPMIDCPSIQLAEEGSRLYADFGPDVRARFDSQQGASTEVAVRGIAAFGSNETVFRTISNSQSVQVNAIEVGNSTRLQMVAQRTSNGTLEWLAAYHRDNGTSLVLSAFDGQFSCVRMNTVAAQEFVRDLSHANSASVATVSFAGEGAVAAQLGL